MADVEFVAEVCEREGSVAGPVVGQDPLDDHPACGEPVGGTTQERGRGIGGLAAGKDLGVGQAGAVVNGDVEVFPADPADPGGAVAVTRWP